MSKHMKLFGQAALLILITSCSTYQIASTPTGMLKTRNYIVTLYATGNGSLYSVRSLDGTLLKQEIPIETMVALYPELEYLQNNDNIIWAGLGIETQTSSDPGTGR